MIVRIDGDVVDWWIVKQLRAMILTDLRDFVPQGYFESEAEKFKLHRGTKNSDHFSRELRWGYLVGRLGKRLFFDSTAIMSARQVSASEVLMNLGMLAGAEAAQGVATQLSKDVEDKGVSDGNAGAVAEQLGHQHRPTLSNNVGGALEQYLRYLTPHEAEPFFPLIITSKYPNFPLSIEDIVGNGESSEVEFKSTLRVNQHTGNRDPRMELAVLKTIAGFLNTNGGILTIGVTDDGTLLGIDADGFENEDKMSLHLVNLIKDRMSSTIMPFIHARFEDYKGCRVMVIECSKVRTPVFVKDGNVERFYIRTGPSTTELSASQTQEYIKQRYNGYK
jgi:hypothetical protein